METVICEPLFRHLMKTHYVAFLLALIFAFSTTSLIIEEWSTNNIHDQTPESHNLSIKQIEYQSQSRISGTNWGLHPGGIGSDEGIVTKIAPNGDLYVAGNVCHETSPCSASFGSSTIYVKDDIFVARLDTNGNWKWVAYTNGSDSNAKASLSDIEIDANGNVYVAGHFGNTKYWGSISKSSHPHTTVSGYTRCDASTQDGFVAKLDSNGTWDWVQTMRDCYEGYARGIALDSNQNVYVVGESKLEGGNAHGFELVVNFNGASSSHDSIQSPCSSSNKRFHPWLAKYDSNGVVDWVDRLSDECLDVWMRDVTTDSTDSAIVTGFYNEMNCWGGSCADTLSFHGLSVTNSNGRMDSFIAKVNSTHSWQWLINGGGEGHDEPTRLSVDHNDDIFITGFNHPCTQHTYCESEFGSNITIPFGGGFVAKARNSGSWEWATRIQPIYTGQTWTTVNDMTHTSNNQISIVSDGYIGRLDSNGVELWNVTNNAQHNSVSTDTQGSTYITGTFTGSLSFENFQLTSHGSEDSFIWKWDRDRDGDTIPDRSDNCQDTPNINQSNHEGDIFGDACDSDDDNDGISDQIDTCPLGNTSWQSNTQTDVDSDGCKDDAEDNDDDNDGVLDESDLCSPNGTFNWVSSPSNDYDSDGCKDDSEDLDDDNDLIPDQIDSCNVGEQGWFSNSTTDNDGDGCLDRSEDLDDDNDGVIDIVDECASGEVSWVSNNSTDSDSDGCQDSSEDIDDDNDGSLDVFDNCTPGILGWKSNSSTDYDNDGCHDSTEDLDDDNDGIIDTNDFCEKGRLNWDSNISNDMDSDGCRDFDEDQDDDGDGFNDEDDYCSHGDTGWISGRATDHDSDGCQDSSEDLDDDGDGVLDTVDDCPRGLTGWTSNGGNDYDGDGCSDIVEDGDDDNDGINDYSDPCPTGQSSCLQTNDGNTTIIHEYPNNNTNQSTPITTTVIHYHNNSTTIVYYHNETKTNETNLSGEILPEINNDSSNKMNESDLSNVQGDMSGTSTIEIVSATSLALIAIFLLLLLIGQLKTKQEEANQSISFSDEPNFDLDSPSNGESSMNSNLPLEVNQPQLTQTTSKEVNETEEPSTPPVDIEGTQSTDGNEWVEYPMGSGKHWYRSETGKDWHRWER